MRTLVVICCPSISGCRGVWTAASGLNTSLARIRAVMPIEFRCTQCQRLLRTREEAAGKKAKCPECGAILDVPSSSAPGEVTSPPPAPPGVGDPFAPSTRPTSDSATPFGPEVPLSSDSAGAENPYQSPRGVEAIASRPAYQPYPDALAYASSRVAGPAIALLIVGTLSLAYQMLETVMFLVGFSAPWLAEAAEMDLFFQTAPLVLILGARFLWMILWILVIVGAVKMKRLENYAWAMTASIIALIPCICPCCVGGIPFGIWALVVLSDSQVQAAFRSASSL